jgi:ribosomal protein S12 methylthiotransferase
LNGLRTVHPELLIVGNTNRIFGISLGCAKNLVDSEHMLGILQENNHELVSSIADAQIVVINTCGFIQEAVEESIDAILEAVRLKTEKGLSKILVTGCFVQRYGYKLMTEIPEVDGWLGTGEFERIGEIVANSSENNPVFYIGRPNYLANHQIPRVRSTPFYSAYLKIAEGCLRQCSFCMIPKLRGPLRSRTVGSLIAEAQAMASDGVKEINLVAQDTTAYGMDLTPPRNLEFLLEELLKIEGLQWIRLLYCHPKGITPGLLDLMDSEEGLCPYIDIPLQHINRDILMSMGRGDCKEDPWELIGRIRSKSRRISLRTTLMVGFPGETDQIFEELLQFVKAAEFDHLGTFVYSPEKGTAAGKLRETVGRSEAERRRDTIMALQGRISEQGRRNMIGKVEPVLIEGASAETDLLLKGRTSTMAPDIDGQVLITKGTAMVGEIMPVLIKEAYSYDLVGELL